MFLSRRLIPTFARSTLPISRRCLSSTALRFREATPSTPPLEELIGGKEGIDRRKAVYQDKYAQALEAKAKAEGVTVEELKRRKVEAEEKVKAEKAAARAAAAPTAGPVPAGSESKTSDGQVVRPAPGTQPAFTKPEGSEGPVKPLNDIMDLSKASTLTTGAIAQLWTTYHQAKGYLSAAIPTETYERMIKSGKKYPIFVLPLARDVAGADVDGSNTSSAVEMHILEWAFLPPPKTSTEPVPNPSTVIFTPLAEYKARQTYAQPYLILTHYTDLSTSHNLVLMRGEITDNVALDSTLAQVLAVRMQLFYNHTGTGGEVEEARKELLRTFHEDAEKFDVQELIKMGEISEIA